MVCAERIKDLSKIAGVRSNQLVGYGLVVGLHGSGDDAGQAFTEQSFRSMLLQFGIAVPPGVNLNSENVAAVALSANLPPFAKKGQTIDVTVSSIGSAESLRGGTLLLSPLKGADGKVYAIAQGNVVVGGFNATGADGSSVTVNIPSVGRIANGATVERTITSPFSYAKTLVLNLNTPDFTTAKRMADTINRVFGPDTAKTIDATSVEVLAPKNISERVNYISVLENLEVKPAEAPAKIIVNSRTGTVVIGQYVAVSPVAVAHGDLTVTISENAIVSQPNALAGGQTTVVESSNVKIEEQNVNAFVFEPKASLNDIVNAINAVGAAPADIVAILEALKEVGALHAELIII
ncbi:MAG: flagellar basal body P-ring protein FlgI [Gammaproteobacteria bacterium]